MSDDYDKIAELVRSGYDLEEALNHVEQTSVYVPDPPQSATTTQEGVVELATDAEVTTGTDTGKVPPVSSLIHHEGVCKAWVNFNGTGTVAIRDDFNVSSITDNGTGDYTVNFTTSMASVNYAIGGIVYQADSDATSFTVRLQSALSTGSFRVRTVATNEGFKAYQDMSVITLIVIGDL